MEFGTAKSVLFIKVSSFQGVLIRGVPLYLYCVEMLCDLNTSLIHHTSYLGSDTILHLTLYIIDVFSSLCHDSMSLLEAAVGVVLQVEVFQHLL